MRNYIIHISAILLLAFVIGSGQALGQDVTLGIKAPPAGSLSTEQLRAVAADIRRLEANPLASDADEATKALMVWSIESPDFTLSMCMGILGGLIGSESKYHSTLLVQFMLSSAAYIIENPEEADNNVKVNVGGLEGVSKTYSILKEQEGDSAKDEFGEMLLKLQEEGKLEEHVTEGLKEC
ncbi:MAG: hypothetical protein AB7H80_06615 [Candidatus Kapaibacterium sp.]